MQCALSKHTKREDDARRVVSTACGSRGCAAAAARAAVGRRGVEDGLGGRESLVETVGKHRVGHFEHGHRRVGEVGFSEGTAEEREDQGVGRFEPGRGRSSHHCQH
ncbi:hypothetical protein FGB62_12g244 [Gracilaria domingensis]|nr:hypothetical protein FGB62_12g244 [Gracilaria domingensis]